MKLNWCLVLVALLCCAIVALAQDETPPQDNPEKLVPQNPDPSPSQDNPENPHEHENDLPEGEKPQDPQGNTNSEGDKPKESSEEGTFCIALLVECPNNTWATQNAQCQYICGASPIGNLSYDQVDLIMEDFMTYYSTQVLSARISNLIGKEVVIQSPPESLSDYCIEAKLEQGAGRVGLPDVYNGVRVLYVHRIHIQCNMRVICQDGSIGGCDRPCPATEVNSNSSPWVTPIIVFFGSIFLSACCGCLRRRKCQKNAPTAPTALQTLPTVQDDIYPAEQYQLLQQQDQELESNIPMHPPVGQPFYPPMPIIPPQMMMPNGTYPVMMQAHNGLWYPVAPPPDDL